MVKTKLHKCEHKAPSDGYGVAVSECWEEEDGTLWVSNEEYTSQVNFCPTCGYEAKVKIVGV